MVLTIVQWLGGPTTAKALQIDLTNTPQTAIMAPMPSNMGSIPGASSQIQIYQKSPAGQWTLVNTTQFPLNTLLEAGQTFLVAPAILNSGNGICPFDTASTGSTDANFANVNDDGSIKDIGVTITAIQPPNPIE